MSRGTKELDKQHRRWKRNGNYYFRIKIPADLLHHYAHKRVLKWSLKTQDEKTARRLVILESARMEEEFARGSQRA